MVLQEIIKNSPSSDYVNIYLYIDDKCVVDYKPGESSIQLIAHKECIEGEKVSLAELIDYSKELDFSEEVLTLECEYERQELNTFTWLTNKLLLSF